jgi:actin-related protein
VGINNTREKFGHWRGDDSLRSFLFTLRNPHGVPPRKFALKKEKKEKAIVCSSTYCAGFGNDTYV